MRLLFSLALTVGLWGTFGSGKAQAFVIIWNEGYTIKHVADLPPAVAQELARVHPMEKPDKIGFRYWYFHIFWADLWTSDGEFVVYRSETLPGFLLGKDKDAKAVAKLLDLPEDKVSKPFFYNVPLGWFIVGGVIVFLIVAAALDKAKKPQLDQATIQTHAPVAPDVERLLTDPRYHQALREANPRQVPLQELSMTDIQKGIDSLVANEVPREQAEVNLARLLEFIQAQQQGSSPGPVSEPPAS